jgi:hypothetical protein
MTPTCACSLGFNPANFIKMQVKDTITIQIKEGLQKFTYIHQAFIKPNPSCKPSTKKMQKIAKKSLLQQVRINNFSQKP